MHEARQSGMTPLFRRPSLPAGLVALALTLLVCACAAPREPGSGVAAGTSAPPSGTELASRAATGEGSGERLVCENIVVTGTRFAKRVCRTQREWDAVRNTERVMADEYGRQTRDGTGLLDSNAGLPSGALPGP